MSVSPTIEAQQRAQSALAASPIHDLRDLRVEPMEREDGLLIVGRVSSYYHKQLAQEVVRSVADDVALVNSIEVN